MRVWLRALPSICRRYLSAHCRLEIEEASTTCSKSAAGRERRLLSCLDLAGRCLSHATNGSSCHHDQANRRSAHHRNQQKPFDSTHLSPPATSVRPQSSEIRQRSKDPASLTGGQGLGRRCPLDESRGDCILSGKLKAGHSFGSQHSGCRAATGIGQSDLCDTRDATQTSANTVTLDVNSSPRSVHIPGK